MPFTLFSAASDAEVYYTLPSFICYLLFLWFVYLVYHRLIKLDPYWWWYRPVNDILFRMILLFIRWLYRFFILGGLFGLLLRFLDFIISCLNFATLFYSRNLPSNAMVSSRFRMLTSVIIGSQRQNTALALGPAPKARVSFFSFFLHKIFDFLYNIGFFLFSCVRIYLISCFFVYGVVVRLFLAFSSKYFFWFLLYVKAIHSRICYKVFRLYRFFYFKCFVFYFKLAIVYSRVFSVSSFWFFSCKRLSLRLRLCFSTLYRLAKEYILVVLRRFFKVVFLEFYLFMSCFYRLYLGVIFFYYYSREVLLLC